VGASDGTPSTPGEASHAKDAPYAMRRSVKRAASDLTRWDFDQNGPLFSAGLTVRDAGDLATERQDRAAQTGKLLYRGALRSLSDSLRTQPHPALARLPPGGYGRDDLVPLRSRQIGGRDPDYVAIVDPVL
jgi:hypothetical protein